MPYRTTRLADQDITDIYLTGHREFGRLQAESYYEGLAKIFGLIADNPRMARERAEFNPPIRLHPYRVHLIAYLLDEEGVLIVRVLHGREEWEKHL